MRPAAALHLLRKRGYDARLDAGRLIIREPAAGLSPERRSTALAWLTEHAPDLLRVVEVEQAPAVRACLDVFTDARLVDVRMPGEPARAVEGGRRITGSSPAARFVRDRCTLAPLARMAADDLQEAFRSYCRNEEVTCNPEALRALLADLRALLADLGVHRLERPNEHMLAGVRVGVRSDGRTA